MRFFTLFLALAFLAMVVALPGSASAAAVSTQDSRRLDNLALAMEGARYQYGAGPRSEQTYTAHIPTVKRAGLDCSAWIWWSYRRQLGINISPQGVSTDVIWRRASSDNSLRRTNGRGGGMQRWVGRPPGGYRTGDIILVDNMRTRSTIDHAGLMLSGLRFTHASSSRGVTTQRWVDAVSYFNRRPWRHYGTVRIIGAIS